MILKKCPHCGAMVREDRLDRHVNKLHATMLPSTGLATGNNQTARKKRRRPKRGIVGKYHSPGFANIVIREKENEIYENSLLKQKVSDRGNMDGTHSSVPYSGNLKDWDLD